MSFLERPKNLVFLEQHEEKLVGKERLTREEEHLLATLRIKVRAG